MSNSTVDALPADAFHGAYPNGKRVVGTRESILAVDDYGNLELVASLADVTGVTMRSNVVTLHRRARPGNTAIVLASAEQAKELVERIHGWRSQENWVVPRIPVEDGVTRTQVYWLATGGRVCVTDWEFDVASPVNILQRIVSIRDIKNLQIDGARIVVTFRLLKGSRNTRALGHATNRSNVDLHFRSEAECLEFAELISAMLQVVRPPLRQSLIRFYPNFIEALVEESYIPTMFGFLFHAAAYGGIAVGVGYLLQLFLDRTLAYGVVFSVWLLLVLLGLLAIHVAAARRWRAKWQQFRARRHQPRFNYPDDWDDLRRIVYARDGYRCMNCGASGVELHAHHIVPLSRGGTNNLTNLTTLCERCHTLLHPHMR